MFETVLFSIVDAGHPVKPDSRALEIAKSHGSRMILLSVLKLECAEMTNSSVESQLLGNTRSNLEKVGITYDDQRGERESAFVICNVAFEENADPIVMSTRGISLDGFFQKTLLSISGLESSPVLLVP